jgi:ribosomal protein L19
MTEENAIQVACFIKSGKKYREEIFEGYIIYEYKNGKYVEIQYQVNPYTGEPREREYQYEESEFIENIIMQDYNIFISHLCQ